MADGSSLLHNFIKNTSLLKGASFPTGNIQVEKTDNEPSNVNYANKRDDDTKDVVSDEQIRNLQNTIKRQKQQIDKLTLEIKLLKQIENDQNSALECAMQHRRELEKQLSQNQTGISQEDDGVTDDDIEQRPATGTSGERPAFLDNSQFLRAFLRKDKQALDDLVRSITAKTDQNIHSQAITTLFQQMQLFMQLNSFFERLSDDSGTDNFILTFENTFRTLIDCRRIILWAYIPSAHVFVSRSSSMIVPETEGLLSKVLSEGQRLVVTDPTRDASYSINYDAPVISNSRVCLYQPALTSKKETIWIIQMIDRVNSKGNVVTPSGDDFLILDFLSLSLIKLYQEESQIDEMIKRILTESTRSLLTERQVLPLLETVQLTVTRIVGCESLQIFFADSTNNELFQLRENQNATHSNEMNISTVQRENLGVEESGIAGIAYKTKKVVNVAVAKEYSGYNANVDGQFPNGAVIAVPLLSSKGIVSLVAVARQKKNGIMFTESDEIILEALSRVSQGALSNAQSHERNIAEIQKALDNHKYYTALLAVAQELSALLDVDTLVRKIMTKAQSFIGADRCSLFLIDKVRGDLWSMVAHGATDRIHIPLGFGIAGHVAATGETLNIPDAYKDSRFNSDVDKSTGYRTRSILCVPINDGNGNVIGCTQMINKLGASEFSSTDVELMTAFNVFCGIALSNAQLFEAATQSKKKMTAMLDIALSLSTSMTLDALVTNIMKQARELIEADQCAIYVNDQIHHTCIPLVSGKEQSEPFSYKIGAIGYVIQTGMEINTDSPYNDRRFGSVYHDNQDEIEINSLLIIPVIDAAGQIVGAVSALNKIGMPKFTEEDQSLLRSFASFAGLAIEQWVSKNQGQFGQSDIELVEQLSPSELTSSTLSSTIKIYDPLVGIVSSNNFNVIDYQRNEQYKILIHFFEEFELLSTYKIAIGPLLRFIGSIYRKYLNVPFHNFDDAVDSTQFVFYEIKEGKLANVFTKIELFALLVSCLCHDIGYSEKERAYNEKAKMPFNVLYKEQPVLEIFHCSSIIDILSEPTCNILANVEQDQLSQFWNLVIDCILATDMSKHAKIISETQIKLNRCNGNFTLDNEQNRNALMRIMVKTSVQAKSVRLFDPEQPWTCALSEGAFPKVSSRTEETFLSANSSDIKTAEAQIEYVKTICKPLFTLLGNLAPSLQNITNYVFDNMKTWEKVVADSQLEQQTQENEEKTNEENPPESTET